MGSCANLPEAHTDLVIALLAQRTVVREPALQTAPCAPAEDPEGLQTHLLTRVQRKKDRTLASYSITTYLLKVFSKVSLVLKIVMLYNHSTIVYIHTYIHRYV